MPSKTRVLLTVSCLAVLVLSLAQCGGSSTHDKPDVVRRRRRRRRCRYGQPRVRRRRSRPHSLGRRRQRLGGGARLRRLRTLRRACRERSAPVQGRHRRRHGAAAERDRGRAHPDPGQRQREHGNDRRRRAIDDGEGLAVPRRGQRHVSPDRGQRQRRARASRARRREDRRAGTGGSTKTFNQDCRPQRREHQDQEVDQRPGCRRRAGTDDHGWRRGRWECIVTNTGTVAVTGVAVTDDRGVRVTCARRDARRWSVYDLHGLWHGDGGAVRECRNGSSRLVRGQGHVNGPQPLFRTSSSKCERREHQDQEVYERPGCRRGAGPTIAVGAPVSWDTSSPTRGTSRSREWW